MRAEKLKGHLELLLLSVLSQQPGHGYEVITRLRQRSGGVFELPEGTVYPALHRLEATGLLSSGWDMVAGRRRRVYRLTPTGELALADQARQWREFSGSMAQVLGGAGTAAWQVPTAGTAAWGALPTGTGGRPRPPRPAPRRRAAAAATALAVVR